MTVFREWRNLKKKLVHGGNPLLYGAKKKKKKKNQ